MCVGSSPSPFTMRHPEMSKPGMQRSVAQEQKAEHMQERSPNLGCEPGYNSQFDSLHSVVGQSKPLPTAYYKDMSFQMPLGRLLRANCGLLEPSIVVSVPKRPFTENT